MEQEQIIVKCPKDNHIAAIIMLLLLCFLPFALLFEYDSFFWFYITPIFIIYVVRLWIGMGRTFILTKDGCTVKFFCFQRFYEWSDMNLKQIEYYSHSYGHRNPYVSGAVFCVKKYKRPLHMKPFDYSNLVHPFCYIVIHFDPDPHTQYKKWDWRYPNQYVVDESEFRNKMSEWNVFS